MAAEHSSQNGEQEAGFFFFLGGEHGINHDDHVRCHLHHNSTSQVSKTEDRRRPEHGFATVPDRKGRQFPKRRERGAYEASGTTYLDIIHPDFDNQTADYPIIETSDLVAIPGRCFVLLVVQKRSVKVVSESCDTEKNLGGC
jgi:hypothetical protein